MTERKIDGWKRYGIHPSFDLEMMAGGKFGPPDDALYHLTELVEVEHSNHWKQEVTIREEIRNLCGAIRPPLWVWEYTGEGIPKPACEKCVEIYNALAATGAVL